MRHPQQIEPQLAGVQTGDYITLEGLPPVNMAITPEVEGGTGTIAMCANMLPFVVAAAPGLLAPIALDVDDRTRQVDGVQAEPAPARESRLRRDDHRRLRRHGAPLLCLDALLGV